MGDRERIRATDAPQEPMVFAGDTGDPAVAAFVKLRAQIRNYRTVAPEPVS